jgi:HSP20 family molecular chaperone IbpA
MFGGGFPWHVSCDAPAAMETPTDNKTELAARKARKAFVIGAVALIAVLSLQAAILTQGWRNNRKLAAIENRLASIETWHSDFGRPVTSRHTEAERLPPAASAATLPGVPAALSASPQQYVAIPGTVAALLGAPLASPWHSQAAMEPYARMRASMDELMAQAMTDFDRMERFINVDEGWIQLDPSPTLDLRDRPEAYVVLFSVPGLDPSRINIGLEGRLLTVSGECMAQTRHASASTPKHFAQAVLLPGPVRSEREATAQFTNGVLRITIQKDLPKTNERKAG